MSNYCLRGKLSCIAIYKGINLFVVVAEFCIEKLFLKQK